MIKLEVKKEPYWLDIGAEVKVKVKPCTTKVFYSAKAYMNNKISKLAKEYKENIELGIKPKIDIEDEIAREALAEEYLTIGLAINSIIDWDNILDAKSDKKAEISEDKIVELFSNFWLLAENFRQQYTGLREIIEQEKKGYIIE